MSLINCKVEVILTWSENCVIISTNVADQNPTFTITGTSLYVPVVTLSTQDNAKIESAEYIDIVMSMYNLIEYSDIIQKHLEAYDNIVKKYQL